MMIKRTSLALVALLALTVMPAGAADVIYPFTDASTPSTNNVGVLVEQGRKGILLRMQCLDQNNVQQNDCWPLASGNPSIAINGGAPIACTPGLSPAANACGYVIGAFMDPNVDVFKIVYNGNFAANAAIDVTVANATGNAGTTESTCPNANDPGCTLHFTIGNDTPRRNTSTELIFDISGSMGLPATQTDTTHTRIQRLIEAANAFLQTYQQHTMLGDELGAVVFSTTASSLTPGVPNFVSGADPTQVDTKVQGPIDTQVPTNTTAIGDGLTTTKTVGFDADTETGNTKWAILFTDGEQNVPPPSGNVSATTGATSQVSVGGTPYSTGTNKLANAGQITICPVTAGLQTSTGFLLQQQIADALCNSQNGYVGMPGDFTTYFQQLFTTVLVGDKLEISRDIASSAATTPTVTFLGNARDLSFTITLTHAPAAERAGYSLIAPDGTVVPFVARRFAGGSVAKIPLPAVVGKKRIATQGQWKVVFNPATFGNAPDYHLIVVNDNPTISTTFTTLGTDLGTGDPLQVQATVLDRGKPLPNATVTVDISGPDFGLGNFLSKTAGRGDLPNMRGDDPGPGGRRKLLILANDPENSKYFGNSPRPPVKLHYCKPEKSKSTEPDDCGKTVPVATAIAGSVFPLPAGLPASGGVYTGTFSKSTLEGHYFFTFHAKGNSAGNGPFERTWKVALFVRPKAYGPNTPILVEQLEGDPQSGFFAQLRVTPHDRLGNFIGPGYDGALELINGKQPFPFTTDNLDGSYEFIRVRTAPGDSKLTLRAVGQNVKTIDLAGAKPGQTL